MKRKVLLISVDGSCIRAVLELPGNLYFKPVKFVSYRGKLYQYTGSGFTCNLFREIPDFYEVAPTTEYTFEEFSKLD